MTVHYRKMFRQTLGLQRLVTEIIFIYLFKYNTMYSFYPFLSNFAGVGRRGGCKQKSILINFTESGRFPRRTSRRVKHAARPFAELRKSRLKSLHDDVKYVMFRRISPSSEKPLNNEVVLRFYRFLPASLKSQATRMISHILYASCRHFPY